MKRLWLVFLCLCFLASSAHAIAPREFEVFNQLQEVPDADLDQMRGRFVSPGGITSFGVVMESIWQTSRGDIYGAGMEMTLSALGESAAGVTFRPSFTLYSSLDQVDKVEVSTFLMPTSGLLKSADGKSRIDVGGLENVTGVTQGIHIVADSNQVANRVVMDISLGATPSASTGGTPSEQNIGQAAGDPIVAAASIGGAVAPPILNGGGNESLTVTTKQGVTLSSGFSREGALVAIDLPGEGRVLQSVGGGILTAAGIRQNAEVLSQFNTIQNTIHLIAQLQDSGGIGNPGNGVSLNMLSGLRQIGALF